MARSDYETNVGYLHLFDLLSGKLIGEICIWSFGKVLLVSAYVKNIGIAN